MKHTSRRWTSPSGWASLIVVDEGGQIMEVGVAGAKTGIPIVKAEGVAEIPAGPVVGVVAGIEKLCRKSHRP